MQMTDEEIKIQYRDAKDKTKQIEILADMNVVTQATMRKKLAELGLIEPIKELGAHWQEKAEELYFQGKSDKEIAAVVGKCAQTIANWRKKHDYKSLFVGSRSTVSKKEKVDPDTDVGTIEAVTEESSCVLSNKVEQGFEQDVATSATPREVVVAKSATTDSVEKVEAVVHSIPVRCMTRARYMELLEEIDTMSANTMGYKNDHLYAAVSEDRLHNFRQGAAITGTTPAQTALAYMAKHLSALIDKVNANDFHDREDLAEKCQDIINYTKFIWLCANDELDWEAKYGHR